MAMFLPLIAFVQVMEVIVIYAFQIRGKCYWFMQSYILYLSGVGPQSIILSKKLVTAPIKISCDWNFPGELILLNQEQNLYFAKMTASLLKATNFND